MVKRIKSIGFYRYEIRRARKKTRAELREDLELYLYSIFKAEQIGDDELLQSATKDLERTERLMLCQSFLLATTIPISELLR